MYWGKKIKRKMIKWTSLNKSRWRQRKSWRITKSRFVFAHGYSWIVWKWSLIWNRIIDFFFFRLVEEWKRRTDVHNSRTERRRPNIERQVCWTARRNSQTKQWVSGKTEVLTSLAIVDSACHITPKRHIRSVQVRRRKVTWWKSLKCNSDYNFAWSLFS